ncbi:MAG TPA: discoidin domain-containing protein, partial [Daejeonella sp.]
GKKITPITNPASKSKGVDALTDGIFASYESWQQADKNWVFYTGEHMDFILDLGEVMPVNTVNMDFLNPQAQPDWHLFALPKYVSYSTSVDGRKYTEPIQVDNPHNPNPIENPDVSKTSFQAFRASMPAGTKARYIKVHGESLLKMPSWHIRSGSPASIYTDQIVVS